MPYFLVTKMQDKGTVPKNVIYRKTSAEIIKEAQNSLSISPGNGVTKLKLVDTRRPITPNVNIRQLYGKTSYGKNRPPSAFNLKYLQHEMRTLPCLKSIADTNEDSENLNKLKVQRSNSLGITQTEESEGRSKLLPALSVQVKLSNSLESCEYFQNFV